MALNMKLQNIAVFIEFLTGAGLAIFFHIVLHVPEAAYIIFGIGILLSVATYLLREDMEKTRHDLINQYHQAHELTFALAHISDPECHCKAEEMLTGLKRTLALLQKGFVPLSETEFYLEGAKCCDTAVNRLKVVDPITTGWLTRGVLVNYYQSNLRAIERGVGINRIFVMKDAEFHEPDVQKILLAQYNDGVEVRIAFKNELPTASNLSGRDTNSSYDFAIYDDQVVTEVFPQSGTYFGRKTSQSANVESFQHLYELIEHSSHSITLEGDKVILASKAQADKLLTNSLVSGASLGSHS